MYRNDYSFVGEVLKDQKKLEHAAKKQTVHAINLVFCDDAGKFGHVDKLRDTVTNADQRIISLFIRRVTNLDGSRQVPEDLTGNHAELSCWFQGNRKLPMPVWPA